MTRAVRVLNYYGSKVVSSVRYPPPAHGLICEPFAGGAGYALRYRDRRVLLVDINPDVIGAWRYLLDTPAEDLVRLPLLKPGETIPEELPLGARLLIGWGCMLIGARPQMKLVPCAARVPSSFWGAGRRAALASLADEIRHWDVRLGDYMTAPNVEATWFIDPPYSGKPGDPYRSAGLDYEQLGTWASSRQGQVIVCERQGAAWMPFRPAHDVRAAPRAGTRGRPLSAEAIWYRDG